MNYQVAKLQIYAAFSVLAFTFLLAAASDAQTIRVCSYNLLDKPTTAAQDQELRVVLQAIGDQSVQGNAQAIDIMAFQEGPMAAEEYNDIEANFETIFGGDYESTISGPDFFGCRTGFVYNQDRVQMLAATTLVVGLTHNIRRALFRPVGGKPAEQFYVYAIHLKAGGTDEAIRAAEVEVIKNNAATLPVDSCIIYCGDFNITGSDEAAYQELFATGSNASAVETLNTPFGFRNNVRWQENLAFQPFHSQDPRTNMDDRFDAFFVNAGLVDGAGMEFVCGSLTVLGNNGTHNIDAGINTGNGAAGFANELVAFSDHLPVFCDLRYGQTPTKVQSNVTVDSILTRFVRQSGPVSGTTGLAKIEVEGTSNGGFASFGIVDFDLSGQLKSGGTVNQIGRIVLRMVQDNASFSANGPVSIYVASEAAAQVPIDNSIQFQPGQNGLGCLPAVLSAGALKVATYAGVHVISGNELPDGTVDPVALFGDVIKQAIINALTNDTPLRLLITPDQAATAATYTGFASSLVPPSLSVDIVGADNSVVVFPNSISIVNGVQGSGNLSSILLSDDIRINYLSGMTQADTQSPVQILFNGNVGFPAPTSLSVSIESNVNTPNLETEIEVFNFMTESWEAVGTANAQLTDESFEVELTGDVTRFVGSGNLMLTRLSWTPVAPVLFFPWTVGIDEFHWTVTP